MDSKLPLPEPVEVTILPTAIWIEDGICGERAVMLQHEGCEPFDVHSILRLADEGKAARAAKMPTEQDCLRVAMEAFQRLREIGWSEAVYSPKDGTTFDAIEFGCSAIYPCNYMGEWPQGGWWAQEAGDLWPARPSLYRLTPVGAAGAAPSNETNSDPKEAP